MVIFQNYAKDLDAVQKLYEKHKYEPPVPRNAPPVAGNIMWARQLLRRIEAPMQRFAQNKNLLAAKESKKIIKTYNKVRPRVIWHVGMHAQPLYRGNACTCHVPLGNVLLCPAGPIQPSTITAAARPLAVCDSSQHTVCAAPFAPLCRLPRP